MIISSIQIRIIIVVIFCIFYFSTFMTIFNYKLRIVALSNKLSISTIVSQAYILYSKQSNGLATQRLETRRFAVWQPRNRVSGMAQLRKLVCTQETCRHPCCKYINVNQSGFRRCNFDLFRCCSSRRRHHHVLFRGLGVYIY